MSCLVMNVDPFSTPVRATSPDIKSGIMTKSQIMELIDSIEFPYVSVSSEFINSDQVIDLEKFLKEMCLALSKVLVKNSPPKTSPRNLLLKIGSSSRDDDTPTKIVPRRAYLESSGHLDNDVYDIPPTFAQRLMQSRFVQSISDENTNSKEMGMSSDQVEPFTIETSDIHTLENTSCSIIDEIPVNVLTKIGQKIGHIVSPHSRVISANPGLQVLDHAVVDDIPAQVLSKVRSEIAQLVDNAKPPFMPTAMQKTGITRVNPFEGITNFAARALWDSGAELSMIAAESIDVNMLEGQKQGVAYAFKQLTHLSR